MGVWIYSNVSHTIAALASVKRTLKVIFTIHSMFGLILHFMHSYEYQKMFSFVHDALFTCMQSSTCYAIVGAHLQGCVSGVFAYMSCSDISLLREPWFCPQ